MTGRTGAALTRSATGMRPARRTGCGGALTGSRPAIERAPARPPSFPPGNDSKNPTVGVDAPDTGIYASRREAGALAEAIRDEEGIPAPAIVPGGGLKRPAAGGVDAPGRGLCAEETGTPRQGVGALAGRPTGG